MDTIALKCLGIGVLFVLAFVGGLIPLCFIRSHSSGVAGSAITRRIISLLNSAAAGVFLGLALVHLLPEVRIIFETSLNITHDHHDHDHDHGDDDGHTDSHFDWAGFTAGVGFLLVVFVEQMMMWCLERSDRTKDSMSDRGNLVKSTAAGEMDKDGYGDYGTLRERSHSQCRSEVSDADSSSSIIVRGLDDDLQPITSFRAIVLLVSLSLHSIFEGLALGLQLEAEDTIDLLIAISIHKAIESFTVLLRFAQIPGRNVLKWSSLLIFSLTSPLGIAIGIPLADPSVDADALLVNGVLQGLATGTFMFVTFVELLPTELAGKHDRLLKYFCLVAGFGLMCGLTQLHSH